MKKKAVTLLPIALMFLGFSLLLYPSVSNYWNSFHQTRAVAGYTEKVSNIDEAQMDALWQEAAAYNEALKEKADRWNLSKEEYENYEKILDASGTGILGVVEIPKIKVSLPVYHGIDDGVLQVAVGHIAGSSLPVGGEGVHTVISGHRGLPSAKLLTNLDRLSEGDVFMLKVLNRTLTYEVNQIRIVEPDDLRDLAIEEGRDYCTLVTCTPYGVNSHRLLVRGERRENLEDGDVRVTSDALQIEPLMVACAVAVMIIVLLFVWLLIRTHKKKK